MKTDGSERCITKQFSKKGPASDETPLFAWLPQSAEALKGAEDPLKDCDLQIHGLLSRGEDEIYRRSWRMKESKDKCRAIY